MLKSFEAAGWFSGRQVDVAAAVPIDHPAYALLAEFGGLTLTKPAPHICSIAFRHVTDGESDMLAWAAALETDMVGIAEEDDGHATLYLSGRGQVIGCSNVHPAWFLVGRTIGEALDTIGHGKRARPMLLPDEDEITLYGVTFRQGDAEVIGPDALI
jgi:hypothetical protein